MPALSEEEQTAFDPPNGFYELAKLLVDVPAKGKDGASIVQVWREIRESLGERVGSNWKETQGQPDIIMDISMANRNPDPEMST